ncbi:MAG: hypothetical protein EHM70_03610 [Chloroflexota bacterium]|nr:MAG: hypothetical protein EHM70_03610 [Chloroflexota bacterium]
MTILMSIFLILHGIVHLLYAGQSRHIFELRPGMTWPDGSWLFSRLFGEPATSLMATILLGLCAFGFFTGGVGLFLHQEWWRPVVTGTAIVSTVIFLLLWDSRFQGLSEQGGVGLLINLALLGVVLLLKWPV